MVPANKEPNAQKVHSAYCLAVGFKWGSFCSCFPIKCPNVLVPCCDVRFDFTIRSSQGQPLPMTIRAVIQSEQYNY
jgi:hypothetical protein